MITVSVAKKLRKGNELHLDGCIVYHGPRGGQKLRVTKARVNGQPKFWKTRPDSFRIPMKCGLRTCFYITEFNGAQWHTARSCRPHHIYPPSVLNAVRQAWKNATR